MEEIIIFSVIISRIRLIQEIELINLGGEMKKFSFILIAIIASFSTVVFAGPKIDVYFDLSQTSIFDHQTELRL